MKLTTLSRLLYCLLALLLIVGSVGPAQGSLLSTLKTDVAMSEPTYASGVVLVGLQPGVEAVTFFSQIQASLVIEGNSITQGAFATAEPVFPFMSWDTLSIQPNKTSALSQIYRLRISNETDVPSMANILATYPDVAFAEPDYYAKPGLLPDLTPNDPQLGEQWGIHKINAPAAWDVTTGSDKIVIAIIDSGIDLTHEDLQGRLWINPDEIPGNGIDDDGNGFVDDVHGWNFLGGNHNLEDEVGHGTQVAGVAGAATNNNKGIAGMCWNCKLMVVKVVQATGVVNYSDLAAGVAYAAEQGAHIINLSLGGYAQSSTLLNAIQSAADSAVIIAGVGNDNRSTPFYPAAYPEVLAVGATDNDDNKSGFSNYGDWVSVYAPGTQVTTTFAGNNAYGKENGTSLSAPFVAGTAGLLRSHNPTWSPALIRQHIINTTVPVSGQIGGRLNASAALNSSPQPQATLTAWTVDGQPGGRPSPNTTFDFTVTLLNTWRPAHNVNGLLTTSDPYTTIPDPNGAFGNINTGQYAANGGDIFRVSLASNTPYSRNIYFSLRLTGDDGYLLDIPLSLQVRSGTENVSGTLNDSQLNWTSDKTYVLTGHVLVPQGKTLTIQPGTLIKAKPTYRLRVEGTLIARGTASQPIVFTIESTNSSDQWRGIIFNDYSIPATFDANGVYLSGSILEYVEISRAEAGVSMTINAPYIASSRFDRNWVGVAAGSALSRFENNKFSNNQTGISIAGGSSYITGNTFTKNFSGVHGSGAITSVDNDYFENTGTAIDVYGNHMSNIIHNRIVGNGGGITISSIYNGVIEHNLIAYNHGMDSMYFTKQPALQVSYYSGDNTIRYNTIFNNSGPGMGISSDSLGYLGYVDISNNNWFGNDNYEVVNSVTRNVTITLGTNYWGGLMDPEAIKERIYDCDDTDDGCTSQTYIGRVLFESPLSEPDQDAPVFVSLASVSDDPLGIQRGVFEVEFSRAMDTSALPELNFHDYRRGLLESFPLINWVSAIDTDAGGRVWIGAYDNSGVYRYNFEEWVQFTTSNSGLADNNITAIYASPSGAIWFGHPNGQISQLIGTNWITHTPSDSLGHAPQIFQITEDGGGNIWFSSWSGAYRLNGSEWQFFPIIDGWPTMCIGIARDSLGRIWMTTQDYIGMFDDGAWVVDNNALPEKHNPSSMFSDSQGRIWVGLSPLADAKPPYIYIAMYNGENWTQYTSANTDGIINGSINRFAEYPDGRILAHSSWGTSAIFDGFGWTSGKSQNLIYEFNLLTIDRRGNLWLSNPMHNSELSILWGGQDYPVIDDAEWVSDTRFRATYDVSPMIPRGLYSLTVSGAKGLDEMVIAPQRALNFQIEYAGFVSDDTPPSRPKVTALNDGSLSNIHVQWFSTDPQGIAQFRYAIGTTPGARDVLDWRYTQGNVTSRTITNLMLQYGKTYYAVVSAQNNSGLWSAIGVSNPVIAGTVTVLPTFIYIPLITR
jgi:subtilisin family serine protease